MSADDQWVIIEEPAGWVAVNWTLTAIDSATWAAEQDGLPVPTDRQMLEEHRAAGRRVWEFATLGEAEAFAESHPAEYGYVVRNIR